MITIYKRAGSNVVHYMTDNDMRATISISYNSKTVTAIKTNFLNVCSLDDEEFFTELSELVVFVKKEFSQLKEKYLEKDIAIIEPWLAKDITT